ncbi:MAG: type II toxin-antitoxin system Phd/YefM family antitoxin [Candidatus Omnitrophota bacterium]|jgi:prevent-host-death family protein
MPNTAQQEARIKGFTNCTEYCTIMQEVRKMDFIVPISEARSKLPGLIKKISSAGKRLIITRNGRAEAVMISPEELETLEVMADQKLLRSILRAEEDIREGKLYSHKDIFKNV